MTIEDEREARFDGAVVVAAVVRMGSGESSVGCQKG